MDLSSIYLHDHDASRPTIFEVVAADEMPELLYNAASHIAHTLATWYPRRFLRANQHFDEIYLALATIVDLRFLIRFNATVAEHFYGLQRSSTKLSKTQLAFSVFSEEAIPYLRRRFRTWTAEERRQQLAERLRLRSPAAPNAILATATLGPSGVQRRTHYDVWRTHLSWWWKRIRHSIARHAKLLEAAHACLRLWFWFTFTFRKSHAHRFGLALASLSMRRITEPPPLEHQMVSTWVDVVMRPIDTLQHILPMALYILQFSQWWYAQRTAADPPLAIAADANAAADAANTYQKTAMQLQQEPCPSRLSIFSENKIAVGQCPLCGKAPSNATAFVPTGEVFCFACVTSRLKTAYEKTASGVALERLVRQLTRRIKSD